MTSSLNKLMTKEESYVQRRQLFKNIWDTALNVDEKEDILAKPKVIKTLRMDEINKCPIGKSKKQRIKNLRHVCKRILEFCNQQDANDKLHKRRKSMSPEARDFDENETSPRLATHAPKRMTRVRRKFNKAKNIVTPETAGFATTAMTAMVTNKYEPSRKEVAGSSSSTPPPPTTKVVRRRLRSRSIKKKNINKLVEFSLDPTVMNRKIIKKKRTGLGRKKKATKIKSL